MDETKNVQQSQPSSTDSAPAPQQAAPAPIKPAAEAGYGKKGSWMKWLLIYVVVAIVVYGVWYLWAHNSGTTTTGY